MSEADNTGYHLITMAWIHPKLVSFDLIAERRRVHGSFVECVRTAISRMTTDPIDWGDPIREYRSLKLTMYRGNTDLLLAYYAVDDVNRLVYFRAIEINPLGPLADPT